MKIATLMRKMKGYLKPKSDPRETLLRMMPENSTCAEIGVWKGGFSQKIISINKPDMLHLIDPWEYQTEFGERLFGGKVAKAQKDMDDIYYQVVDTLRDNSKVKIHRNFSDKAVNDFTDEYFDWIYIDGNHYYEYVLNDLALYFPKVKKGGFITGDDYYWSSEELQGDKPVKRAVQDFVKRKKGEVKIVKILGTQFIMEKCI